MGIEGFFVIHYSYIRIVRRNQIKTGRKQFVFPPGVVHLGLWGWQQTEGMPFPLGRGIFREKTIWQLVLVALLTKNIDIDDSLEERYRDQLASLRLAKPWKPLVGQGRPTLVF